MNPSATRRSWQAKEDRHGQGSDAQRQEKEETQAGQEQEGQGRGRVAVQRGSGPARPESLRQEGSMRRRVTRGARIEASPRARPAMRPGARA